MPAVQIDFSNALLTAVLHNQVSGQVGCGTTSPIVTDVDVIEVEALRGDERDVEVQKRFAALGIPLTADYSIEVQPPSIGSNYQPPLVKDDDRPGRGHPTPPHGPVTGPKHLTITVPATFLRVRLSARVVSPDQLDRVGNSDAIPSLPPINLLFRVTQATPVGGNVTLKIAFVDTFDAPLEDTAFASALTTIRDSLSGIPFSVPIGPVLSLFGAGAITNANVIASMRGFGVGGVRLALDLEAPTDVSDWLAIYAAPGKLRLADGQDWGVYIDHTIIEQYVSSLLPADLPYDDGTSTKVVALLTDPKTTWRTDHVHVSIELKLPNAPMIVPGSLELDVTPLAGTKDDASAPDLSFRLCASIDPARASVIPLNWDVALLSPAVEYVFNTYLIPSLLSNFSPSGFTTVADGKCVRFARELKVPVAGIGTLVLSSVVPDLNGLFIGGVVQPALALLAPGKLEVSRATGWMHIVVPCQQPDPVPTRRIVLRNTGALPLQLCAVEGWPPDGLPNYLGLFDSSGQRPLGDIGVLAPGGAFVVVVRALIAGQPDYEPSQPLRIRIRSTAGCDVLDLNSDGAATVPTADELADLSRLSSELCKLLGDFSSPVGPLPSPTPPFPFVDPLPFDAGSLRERIVVGAHAGHATVERIVYRAMAPIDVGQRVLGAFRLGSRLYVRAPNLILSSEVRGRSLGQWTVAWVPGEHAMRHDGRHINVDGPHPMTFGEHLRPAHPADAPVVVQRRSAAPTDDVWAHFIEWDDVAFEWTPGSDRLAAYERHIAPMAVRPAGRSSSRS